MGFESRTGGNYFTILGGKFAIRVPKGTPGSVMRINKVGKEVHEKYEDAFTGNLVGIRVKADRGYGKQWEFDFQDQGEIQTLQLSYSNSFSTSILKILPNVDLSKEMKVQPSQKMEDGKPKSSLFISQDGVTLKHAYTKDAPNGLPPMVQIMVKGTATWDDTDRLTFLEEMVNRDIIPNLPKAKVVVNTPDVPVGAVAEVANPMDVDTATVSDEDDY